MDEKPEHTEITLEIQPFFRIHLASYGLGQGLLHIRILVFSFYLGFYYGLGWSISPDMDKWFCGLRIHLKRVLIALTFGIELSVIFDWKIKRQIRKLSPAKMEQLKQVLSGLLEETKD